jgi:hypothetical protein
MPTVMDPPRTGSPLADVVVWAAVPPDADVVVSFFPPPPQAPARRASPATAARSFFPRRRVLEPFMAAPLVPRLVHRVSADGG